MENKKSPGRPKRAVGTQKPATKTATAATKPSSRRSPSRKSPARKASPDKIKEKILNNEITTMNDKNRSSPTRNLKVRLEKTSIFTQNIQITTQNRNLKSSTDTIDIGSHLSSPQSTTKYEDTSGDSEILKITSFPQLTRRSSSVTKLTPTALLSTQRLTSTPSVTGTMTDQFSRQSRSASRSVYDASKTEYSDNEYEIADDRNIGDENDDDDDDDADRRSTASSYSNYCRTKGIRNFFKNSFGLLAKKSTSGSGVDYYASQPQQKHQYFGQLPKDHGGAFGCILLISLFLSAYYLQWCSENSNKCTLKWMYSLPSLETLKTNVLSLNYISELFETYFTKDTIYGYILYTFVIYLLLLIVRIGYKVKLPSEPNYYHFNTFSVSIVITIGLIVSEIQQLHITDFILKNYIKFMLYNILNVFIISAWLYIRSFFIQKHQQLNPYGTTNSIIHDICVGREINPKWFNIIDIKLFYYHLSIFTTLIILETLIIKNLYIPKLPIIPTSTLSQQTQSEIVSITLEITSKLTQTFDTIKYYIENINCQNGSTLFITVLILIYLFDIIIYEHHLLISFELKHEGVGTLLLLRYAIQPFLLCSLPKYAYDTKKFNLSIWLMLFVTIICIIGIILKRSSMRIKYLYRMDPYKKEFLLIPTQPTFHHSKRLLLDKLWGNLRQPNYTGDLISLLSFEIAIILNNYNTTADKYTIIPLLMLLIIIINLLYRANYINKRNSLRYSTPWHIYCTKVPYMMIPKIY